MYTINDAKEVFFEIQDLVDQVPEGGEEFADSVMKKSLDIMSTVESMEGATENQLRALENMRNGLEKWVRN